MAARITPSRGGKPDKVMRDALLIELKRAASGGERTKKLQRIAEKLVELAMEGEVAAIKEVFDRIDGKSVQPIAGSDDDPAIKTHSVIEFRIVDPAD